MNKAATLISWTSILLLALFAYWGLADQMPSEKYLQSEMLEGYSLEKVMDHLEVISKDIHFVGTPYHKEVQNYLMEELRKLGLDPQIQQDHVFSISDRSTTGARIENIVAEIKGSGNGKALMLMAHYDSGLPNSYGASDDGSGIATILEAVRVFLEKNEQPKNDIIILFSDAEEIGLKGARAFIEQNPLANKVGLILNFEARGSGGPSYMLMETNGKNGKLLEEFMKANPGYPSCNSLAYSVYKLLPNDTDLTPMREIAGINGFNFAYLDDHFDYHTAQDIPERLDRATLVHQADYLMSNLNYFAFSDLENFEHTDDKIFVNMPFIKLLQYPFSWNTPLLLLAFILTIVLVFVGVKRKKLNFTHGLKGLIPFLISLVANCLLTFGLWQLILLIHPTYEDILCGYTYNGYYYQAAFMALNAGITFLIYKKWMAKYQAEDLIVGPIIMWLILNTAILLVLPGGAFLILPVFFALGILAIHVLSGLSPEAKQISYSFLSLPLLYMLTPLIKLLPVALGLMLMAIGTFFLIASLGLLIPIFTLAKKNKYLTYGFGAMALIFFTIATAMSGYNVDRRKNNSINFFYNADKELSYWASINEESDPFLDQFFGESTEKGGLPEEMGFNLPYIKTIQKTENRAVKTAELKLLQDSLISEKRFVEFSLSPQRAVNVLALMAKDSLNIIEMKLNGSLVSAADYEASEIRREKDQYILNYCMPNSEKELRISILMENEPLEFDLREVSYDLLENELFDIEARADYMMPTQFIGDALFSLKSFKL
ncbi:MAG: M20/M25/M40 family metallo-hydrolase [Bacteroidota bacterium]